MGIPTLSKLFAPVIALLFAAAMAFPIASARAETPCFASVPPDIGLERIPEGQIEWKCDRTAINLDAWRNVVRLDIAPENEPRFAISRAAKFSSMSIGVETASGVSWSHTDFDNIEATFFDRQFAVPLPDHEGQASAVYVVIEGATQATTFDYLHLADQLPGSSRADIGLLIVVALFTGMMLMPILFDLVGYRILRETFMLWHALLVITLAVQLVCSYGLYVAFVQINLPMVRAVTIGSFSLMVFAAVMFSLRFIEPDRVPSWLRATIVWLTLAFVAISCVHLAGIEGLGRWPSVFYFTSGAPLGIAVVAMLYTALRNGSRTARFLAIGLSPLLFVAMIRVVSFTLPGVPTIDANELLIAATLIEVCATGLGVASRFLALKRERDHAHAVMDELGDMAEHDALTGLHNRRILDTRFGELREEGFDTFALIDLDHFKDINDRYGHLVGDTVLTACAEAIRGSDRDTMAMRLGGEEFVIMLRGAQSVQRAEALRQSIPMRVGSDVEGLDHPVTASMGVIEMPGGADAKVAFDEVYARADALLYEAKASGRNRMLHEQMGVCAPPLSQRPEEAAAA